MTTREIRREFVITPGYDGLSPVSLPFAWSSFMNTYAVWDENSNSITIRRSITLQAGYYYVTGTVDNYGSVNINGRYNINLYNFDANISRTEIRNNTRIYHGGGNMSIVISATNTGGPRGVAVTISAEVITGYSSAGGVVAGSGGFGTNAAGGPTVGVGGLVWSTRSPAIPTVGRYFVTMPFRASITAHAWGAGGGGGGMDAGTQGGLGAPGLYNTTTFNVLKGDTLEVFVGKGGNGGGSNSGSAPGGSPGLSRINVNGNPTTSFNGGAGSAAGPAPFSGGGGGGGGASGVLVNNIPLLISAGGGGGGGAGNDRNGATQYARRDAVITNNAIGLAGSDYRGENGQAKGGDGGGAGAGGGGYPGGQGGPVFGGDASGFAGQCGGNFPVYAATTGTNTAYYKSGFAGGGDRGGGSGQNGRVFLLIRPVGLNSLKVAGEWKQISDAFVKIDGNWKLINNIFIKVNDKWSEVNGSGLQDINFIETTGNYGASNRLYS